MKLNLGCGEFKLKDFVNIDVYEENKPDLVCNAMKLPHENNSIDELFCGHCIEHMPIAEARIAFKEWLRVLKKGSKIGIVVPDKDTAPNHFVFAGNPKNKKYLNHNSYWNYQMLEEELRKTGFEDIRRMNIDTYPHLVARPHWQVGAVAIKGGGKMKSKKLKEISLQKPKEFKPTLEEIEKHAKLQETWCKHEMKFVYNPTKKKHCPYCLELF